METTNDKSSIQIPLDDYSSNYRIQIDSLFLNESFMGCYYEKIEKLMVKEKKNF